MEKKSLPMMFLALLFAMLLTLSCSDDEETLSIIEASETEVLLDPLDEGGRWLVSAMEETIELNISDNEKATLTNHFNDLALDLGLRCNETTNDDFLNSIASYPQEAIDLVEDTQLRLCSDLNLHEGYWIIESVDPTSGSVVLSVSDVHIDAATTRITVYAQTTVDGIIYQPAQVGPGEDPITTLTGETAAYHPNAVYLNGSGEEYLEDVGGGSWWVKHSWISDGGSYMNWPLGQFAIDYGPGFNAESILLDDGYTIKVGDLDGDENGQGNIREPILTSNPVSYHVSSFQSFEDTDPVRLLVQVCTEGVSALDGLARFCPASTGDNEPAESFTNEQEVTPTDASVQYEIFQIISETEIIAWANTDGISQEEFDALELPSGWTKNQPRETLWDGGEFASSPGQEAGVFINEELFGFQWQHVATVGESGYPMDPDAILVGSDVFKSHTVFYNQGSTVQLVISPEADTYLFATRDANRTTDVATIPQGWQSTEFTAEADIQIQLPNPTVNIRADNQDSFQGPLTENDFQPRQ